MRQIKAVVSREEREKQKNILLQMTGAVFRHVKNPVLKTGF